MAILSYVCILFNVEGVLYAPASRIRVKKQKQDFSPNTGKGVFVFTVILLTTDNFTVQLATTYSSTHL